MSFRRSFVLAGLLTVGTVQAETATHAVVGNAEAGASKAAACGACHGADGNSSLATYPKLAAQQASYTARQLALFKANSRVNPIMAGFVATLSEQDMHDLGAYFAAQKPLPGVADSKLAARGEALYHSGDAALNVPACMACHGPDGSGNPGAGYPRLAGQWTDYVGGKLTDWKAGTSWGSDDHAAIMPDIAKRLSEQDIAAVASYIEGLHTASGGSGAAD